jgi:hypothetical protein
MKADEKYRYAVPQQNLRNVCQPEERYRREALADQCLKSKSPST